MNFTDLEAFHEVAEHQSFSRAAISMRIAQSALSRRVARLEHQLGLKLFARHGRGIRLTPDGEALALRANGLMREVARIGDDIRGRASEPSGRIIVAFTPTSGQILAPPLLAAARQYPNLEIELREGFSGSIHNWLSQGAIDIALIYDPEPNPDFDITPLLREPLLLAGAPQAMEAFGNGPVSLKKLKGLPLVLPGRSHSVRRLLDREAQKRGLPLTIRNQVDGMRTIKGVVEAGLGYTIFSYAGLYEEIREGRLVTAPFSPQLHWTFSMVVRRDAGRMKALQFVRALLVAELHRLIEGGLWQGKLLV